MLKATLLQAFFSVRSERQPIEQMECNFSVSRVRWAGAG
jgi:hypothetical protein